MLYLLFSQLKAVSVVTPSETICDSRPALLPKTLEIKLQQILHRESRAVLVESRRIRAILRTNVTNGE